MGEKQYDMNDEKENRARRNEKEDEETKWMRDYIPMVQSNCEID